ncbi:MAG: hypothetical protein Q9222_003924 [Ikaeria aurantiellina]
MTYAKSPSPISWAPSQWWDGIDGNWSSFDLRVGTPEQAVRVLPSTAASATWIVRAGGCDPPSLDCTNARGGLFNESTSSTWNDLGHFTLALEQNLGHNESGAFGLDTLSIGLSNATGGPTLNSQIIAGIETQHWYTGMFGLQQQPMNLSDFDHPQQSFLSSLRSQNLIPSLSWAYTAGAHYRSKGSFGSLILGGSDTSRYVPSNFSFKLAPDVTRDLVVGIKSITCTLINGSMSSLLPSPTLAFIDSTVPYLYLPPDACTAFESALGLVYNKKNNLYFVDDALHQTLSNINPRFTFHLANDKVSESTVSITLPYASFDLTAKPPLLPNSTSYFPLRRGADNQITLGRAFLQEAYIITDYEQKNFTVAQARFDENTEPEIVPIPWNATAVPQESRRISRPALIGISVGWRKYRTSTKLVAETPTSEGTPPPKHFSFIPTQEIGRQSVPELHGLSHHWELLDQQVPSGSGNPLNELSAEPEHASTRGLQNDWSPMASRRSLASVIIDQRHSSRSGASQGFGASGFPSISVPSRTVRTVPSQSRWKASIDKALPNIPIEKAQDRSESSRRSPPVSPTLQNLHVPRNAGRSSRDAVAQKAKWTAATSLTSPAATYATVFDFEDYKVRTTVSGFGVQGF